MVDVSICIVNYNAKDLLDNCIRSVLSSIKDRSFEIIVIDNASTDGSQNIAKKYPSIKFIHNASNLGFIKANNIGIKNSTGRYVLSLNNDTVVKSGAIEKLIGFMDKTSDAGAVGPKLLNGDGSIQMQCRRGFPTPSNSIFYFLGLSRLFPKNRIFGAYLMTYLDDAATSEVDSLCGAAMMVRREVIEKVGLMDESYYMYGDDIDWCYRIKRAGWKVYYLPEAEIVHYGGRGGSRRQSYRNIFEFHRAMAVFYGKHYSKGSMFLMNWLVYAGIWLKCAAELIKNVFRKDKYVGTKKP
jgi:GT2 family glycosyltransferase